MKSEAIWKDVEEYINRKVVKQSAFQSEVLDISEKEGLPPINVQPPEGKLFSIIARSINAKRALEIGVLGGFSGLWILSGMENGTLIGLEKSEKHARIAKENFVKAGYGNNATIMVGDALSSLNHLIEDKAEPFDIILIDADKPPYLEYFKKSIALSHSGTIIFVDNMVWNGDIANRNDKSESSQGIRKLYDQLELDERVVGTVIQTVGTKGYDGFAVLRVS